MNSHLPEWIGNVLNPARPGKYTGPENERFMGCCTTCDGAEEIKEALSIAWEALDNLSQTQTEYKGHAKEAMRRIEELSK